MDLAKLKNYIEEKGYPKFRYQQIFEGYLKGYTKWSDFKNLSKDLKNDLSENVNYHVLVSKIVKESKNNRAYKAILETEDKKYIESVAMVYYERVTLCLSSQIGCTLKCKFCASGQSYERNLSYEEIIEQILFWQTYFKDKGLEIKNLVFMGMGEPFLNWENVFKSIEIISDKKGLGFGQRHITISTAGLVPEIRKFTEINSQINLAISLNAATNKIRDQIMPINKKYPINKIITAAWDYVETTKRKLFFEYILLRNINDSDEEINKLIEIVKSHYLYHLNLISYNQTSGELKASSKQKIEEIIEKLDREKIKYTFRASLGDDIEAACGQLKSKYEN